MDDISWISDEERDNFLTAILEYNASQIASSTPCPECIGGGDVYGEFIDDTNGHVFEMRLQCDVCGDAVAAYQTPVGLVFDHPDDDEIMVIEDYFHD